MDLESVLSRTIGANAIEMPFSDMLALERPLLIKGTAFTAGERVDLGLLGLPPHEETLEEPAERAHDALKEQPTDLERHIDLRQLRDANETLFVVSRAMLDGPGTQHQAQELERLIDAKMWHPKYLPVRRKR